MNADGSSPTLVRAFDYRVGQPKVSPDGNTLLFTATTPWYPVVGLFALDLTTSEVQNLSAVDSPAGAADSDPMYSADGRLIVYADNRSATTQIGTMSPDGTGRRLVTRDSFYNVDADISPSLLDVAYSSYRGPGTSKSESGDLDVKIEGWRLVTKPINAAGPERELTQGMNCTGRSPDAPCTPDQAAGFKPRYDPTGSTIGFVTALDGVHTCVCLIGRDGSNPSVYVESADLAIDWFDWVRSGTPAPRGYQPGPPAGPRRALIVAERSAGRSTLIDASIDFSEQRELPVPDTYDVTAARWGENGDVIFSARASIEAIANRPHPAPPPGSERRDHFTLDQLGATDPDRGAVVDITEQLFLRRADGTIQRLTDPWSEDWRDGLIEGDSRSNSQPRVSPGGRFVTFTSSSRLTGESFIMRLSLDDGSLLNLSNGTSGVTWIDDQHPTFTPAGDQLLFTFTSGSSDVWRMESSTGFNVTRLTDDDRRDASPVASPDGRTVVYSSYRGEGEPATFGTDGSVSVRQNGWVLIGLDLATGRQTPLTDLSDPPAFQPEVDPSGRWVYYLGSTPTGPRLHRVPLAGGARPRIVAGDARAHRSLDIR